MYIAHIIIIARHILRAQGGEGPFSPPPGAEQRSSSSSRQVDAGSASQGNDVKALYFGAS